MNELQFGAGICAVQLLCEPHFPISLSKKPIAISSYFLFVDDSTYLPF